MSLPRVRLQTLRRLLDHLRDVTEHAEEESDVRGYDAMINQVNVLKDLILGYTIIFRVSLREMHAKSKMDMLQ
uniref:Uncharacterized protein n=1 Tax=Parascaris equorum TaxID=6256 RepID=A0A914R4Q9_PAREQ